MNSVNPISSAYSRPELTPLGRLFAGETVAHAGQSGFQILDTGRQALAARLALIEAAQHALDLQYYIWNSDISGGYMARRLLLAADRGIRVRLLLDDVNIGGRDPILVALDTHPNIEVKIFNPAAAREGFAKMMGFLGDFNRLNRRMHNKTFVADGAVGILGGRNIGDEYFDLHAEMNFRDRDMLAVGPIVQDISGNFDAYWNSPWAWSVAALKGARLAEEQVGPALDQARTRAADGTGLREVPPQGQQAGMEVLCDVLHQLVWAEADLVYDPPVPADVTDGETPKLTAQALGALIHEAQHEVLIESAYLIPGEPQLALAESLTSRGVKLRALTNSLATNDLTANHAGYARSRPDMLKKGAELYEFRPDAPLCQALIADEARCSGGAIYALHAKSIAIDRKLLYVGSFNINLRSIHFNSETVLIIRSPVLAAQVADALETAMQPGNSWRVRLDAGGRLVWESGNGKDVLYHDPQSSWWRRFKVGIVKLLPLEKYY